MPPEKGNIRYNNFAPAAHGRPAYAGPRRTFSRNSPTLNAITQFDITKQAKEEILRFRELYLKKALTWWSTTKKNINAGRAPTEEDRLLNDIILDENDLIPKGVRGATLGVDLDRLSMESIEPVLKAYKAYDVYRQAAQRALFGKRGGTRKRAQKRKQTKRR